MSGQALHRIELGNRLEQKCYEAMGYELNCIGYFATYSRKDHMTTIRKAAELVEDFDLYPRSKVDSSHVAKLVQALAAGEILPPIIIDAKSGRIIDGFHRRRAALRAFGDNADIECDERSFKNSKEMYLDAMRFNSKHGKGIVGSEQTGAIVKGRKLKIKDGAIAAALCITTARYDKITTTKMAIKTATYKIKTRKQRNLRQEIALKRSVYHLAGKELTEEQADAMPMLPGQTQRLLIAQVSKLIETDSIDLEDQNVVTGLVALRELLDAMDLGVEN